METLKYVSPEYQEQLDRLAETLMASRQCAALALEDTVEFTAIPSEVAPTQE